MRFLLNATFLVAVAACLVFFVNADEWEWDDNEFNSAISQHENVLVMFYAPWCGHCKRLKPEYEAAAKALVNNDPPIKLVKVDCTEGGKDTCSKFGVSGYPTLKIFKNGEETKDYSGPRDKDGIIRYMKAQVGPVSLELKSIEDLHKFVSSQAPCVVGYFTDDSSSLKTSFLKIADKLREKLNFAHTSVKSILDEKKISSDSLEVNRPPHLHNKLEDNTATYSGSADLSSIDEFISKSTHGLVGHRTRESQGDFTHPLVTAYYKVDYKKNPKGTNYWRNRVLKVAKKFVDDFKFAISSVDEFQNELNDFGIDFVPGDKPVVGVINAKKEKFILDKDFSVEKLEEFLNDVKDGKLQPYLKSEPIPEDNSGPVKVAVGKNFKELVEDSGRDSFIEFYAPWCGHCKKLAPIWDKLGAKLEGEKVDIIKLDATSNDIPAPFKVHGYPTLYWAPANNKQNPVKYEGGRELKDLLSYVAKHATEELEGYDREGKSKTGKDEL